MTTVAERLRGMFDMSIASEDAFNRLSPAGFRLLREAHDALKPAQARPGIDWHEDDGDVLWWRFPVDEAPWVGSPLAYDWPGYHTHWTPLPPPPCEPAV